MRHATIYLHGLLNLGKKLSFQFSIRQ